MRFVDTNILIYAISPNPTESEKQRIALDILVAEELTASVQVLQEFYYQITRSSRRDAISHNNAIAFIESIGHIRIQDITFEVFRKAVSFSQRFHISYWDSAILAAAEVAGCIEVYSEDLNHGQDYDGIRVINPFVYSTEENSLR